jgi:hypothetical protein
MLKLLASGINPMEQRKAEKTADQRNTENSFASVAKRGWTGLSSFGLPVWLALSIVFGFRTADQFAGLLSPVFWATARSILIISATGPEAAGTAVSNRREARASSVQRERRGRAHSDAVSRAM